MAYDSVFASLRSLRASKIYKGIDPVSNERMFHPSPWSRVPYFYEPEIRIGESEPRKPTVQSLLNKWIKKDLMGGGFKATETELLFSDRLEVNYLFVSEAENFATPSND